MILTNRYQGFDPRKNVPRASWSSWDEMQKPLFLTPNVVSFWIIFTPHHFGTHKKGLVAYTYQFLDRLGHLGTLWLPKPFLQKSDKGQVFYWSSQTSTRFSRLVVTMLKKPQNCPISDFFILTPKYFLPYCLILTWNRLLLYHQVPNSTWPSTITYQPVPPYTDPLPPRTNQDRPILTHFHQVPTNTAPYWPSITKYQPTPPHTDPLLPQTNQHRSILTQYHQVPTSTAPYWPITTTNQPVPPNTGQVPPSTNQSPLHWASDATTVPWRSCTSMQWNHKPPVRGAAVQPRLQTNPGPTEVS